MSTDPQEILAVIKQAAQMRREDLQGVAKDHSSNTATHILLTNQARLSARLINADPNTSVDVPEDVGDEENFTTPPPEETLS